MPEKGRRVNGISSSSVGIDKTDEMGKDTGMDTKYITHSTEETKRIAAEFAHAVKPGTVVALRGDLGAGKTTFVQGMLETLGAEKPYVSPTFVIMKEYDLPVPSAGGIARIYHVDAYRIDEPEEIGKLGFEEWCADPEGIVLVEWPEKLGNLIPESAEEIFFRWMSDADREIVVA